MKIHRNVLFVLFMVAMPAFAGGAGKASLGSETIEILSWSFSNTYTGQTTVNSGVLLLTVRSVPSAVAQLCQSHAPVPALTIEADGQRREYRNVAFKDCAGGALTLTVSGQPAPGRRPAARPALRRREAALQGK